MTATEAVRAARARLRDVTPLASDCGALCAAACCQGDARGRGGMLLFPGEEAFYTPCPDWADCAVNGDVLPGMRLLTCRGVCPRGERPLACRLFPLTPLVRGETLRLAMDVRARAVCPLYRSGVKGLHADFLRAARESARILYKSDAVRAYLAALDAHLECYQRL